MKQTKFYFDHKDAIAVRKVAVERLIGKTWKPFNSEVKDIIIAPNEDTTYHLEVIFTEGKQITLYQFLEENKLHISSVMSRDSN